jgi:phage shock protein A
MKLMQRWKSTVVSSFEHVLSQVENHEAVVAAAIRDAREAAAGARVKLNRLRRDGERLRTRIAERQATAATWAARAVQVHASEPAKALECMRRRQQALAEAGQLEQELAAHREIEDRLTRDLSGLEARIADLGRRRHSFAAREFRAKAIAAGETAAAAGEADAVEEVFDRWELKLARTEPMGPDEGTDPLESAFVAEEERASLEAELAALLRQSAETTR